MDINNGDLFENYLKKYEHCLGSDDEKGPHKEDGIIDENEISVFFSKNHIEIDSDESSDGKISNDEFDTWYEANEDAISAYFENFEGIDYDTGKDIMKESMVNFVERQDDDSQVNQHDMSDTQSTNKMDSEEYKILELQYQGIDKAYRKEVNDLHQELSQAEDVNTRNQINAKIAKLIHENERKLNDIRINQQLLLSDLPEDKKEEFKGLYDDLSNASSQSERDLILVDIEARQAEYGVSDKEKQNSLYIQYWCIENSYNNEESALYEDMSQATTEEQRDTINICISALRNQENADLARIDNLIFAFDSNLPDDQAEVFDDLFEKLSKSYTKEERSSLISQLEAKAKEFNISEKEYEIMLAREHFSVEEATSNNHAKMYEDYAWASDPETKERIYNAIREVETSDHAEINEIFAQRMMLDTKLPEDQAEVMNGLYDELKNAGSLEDASLIMDAISKQIDEFGLNNEEKALSARIQGEILSYLENSTLNGLYENLNDASGEDSKERINAAIRHCIWEYQPKHDEMNVMDDIYRHDFTSGQISELNGLYEELTLTQGEAARDEILAKIRQKIDEFLEED